MLHLWDIELPKDKIIADCSDPFWNYNGRFFSSTDGICRFLYQYRSALQMITFSIDGRLLNTSVLCQTPSIIPSLWETVGENRQFLLCGDGVVLDLSTMKKLDTDQFDYQEEHRKNMFHLENDSFQFGKYRIDHVRSFGFQCTDTENGEKRWKISLQGYLYADIQIDGDNLYFCTAGHGGGIYCVDLPSGKIRYEIKTGGTSKIILLQKNDNTLLCYYTFGRKGTLEIADASNGNKINSFPLETVSISCPLWMDRECRVLTLSMRFCADRRFFVPVLSCYIV